MIYRQDTIVACTNIQNIFNFNSKKQSLIEKNRSNIYNK